MGTGYYSRGRQGRAIAAIVPHISCCSTIAGIDNTFGPYSTRKVSTHYAVSETEIHQYVHEYDTAWSVGNWEGNLRTISIEHVGTTANPPTGKCLDLGARLMADIAYRLGWKVLKLGDNVMLHRWYASTACPANMDYEWEVSKANHYLAKLWLSDDEEEQQRKAAAAAAKAKAEAAERAKKAQERARIAKLKSTIRRNNGMEMLFYIKGESGTRYVCGGFQRVLSSPAELTAIEDGYRMAYGLEIPHVTLNAEQGKAFLAALATE